MSKSGSDDSSFEFCVVTAIDEARTYLPFTVSNRLSARFDLEVALASCRSLLLVPIGCYLLPCVPFSVLHFALSSERTHLRFLSHHTPRAV